MISDYLWLWLCNMVTLGGVDTPCLHKLTHQCLRYHVVNIEQWPSSGGFKELCFTSLSPCPQPLTETTVVKVFSEVEVQVSLYKIKHHSFPLLNKFRKHTVLRHLFVHYHQLKSLYLDCKAILCFLSLGGYLILTWCSEYFNSHLLKHYVVNIQEPQDMKPTSYFINHF